MSIAQRLSDLGIELPATVTPSATYVRFQITGNLLYISGTVAPPEHPKGKLGGDVSLEQGYAAARGCGLQILATAAEALGSLDRITKTVKVLGMVNATPDFTQHPQVINGCSDLLVEVLDDAGKHTRSAVGMGSLPHGVSVEIEATFEFE